MRPTLPRLAAAVPDAITSGAYLTAWIAPAAIGAEAVTNLMLTMLIEFIVMHSSGFYAGLAAAGDIARGKRALMLTGLTAFYFLFIVGFALAFKSSWPLWAFGWLFVSRFMHLWTRPVLSAGETDSMFALWAVSVAAYLFGAFATVMLPLPRLGMTPEFVASMALSGSGEWIERPYTVIAFGAVYFALQAWAKYGFSASGTAMRPAPAAPAAPAPSAFAQRLSRIAKAMKQRQTPGA